MRNLIGVASFVLEWLNFKKFHLNGISFVENQSTYCRAENELTYMFNE